VKEGISKADADALKKPAGSRCPRGPWPLEA